MRAEFGRPELRPFDVGHLFSGSWKWIGWFATEFTWVGRWIMHSIVTGDRRAVNLWAGWLQHGTDAEQQSQALRYALHRLTGRSFATDREWVGWHFADGGMQEYPEPPFMISMRVKVVLASQTCGCYNHLTRPADASLSHPPVFHHALTSHLAPP